MSIEISGFQVFILFMVVVVTPLLGYFINFKYNNITESIDDTTAIKKRTLVKVDVSNNNSGLYFRNIDWSFLYGGWLVSNLLKSDSQKLPFICFLSDLDQKGAWSQPVKIGVNSLIFSSKNYLQKF